MKDLVRSVQAKVVADANPPNFIGYSTANQVQSILRRIYNWAIEDREWLGQNPASFEALFPMEVEPRDEQFSPASFAKVWHWNVAQATGKDERISVALARRHRRDGAPAVVPTNAPGDVDVATGSVPEAPVAP